MASAKAFFTRILSVRNNGVPTPYTHVQLGTIDIIFKNSTVIGIETPKELYRSENYDSSSGIQTMRYKIDAWSLTPRKYQEVSEEAILVHLNRLLKEQAEAFINASIKAKLVGKRR